MADDLKALTVPECERYRAGCNFSPAERAVFDLRVRGMMIYQIAADLHLSESAVYQRLRAIRRKIRRFDFISKKEDRG